MAHLYDERQILHRAHRYMGMTWVTVTHKYHLLSIVHGYIILQNILALLHKHENFRWRPHKFMHHSLPQWDVAQIAALQDIYDVDPDYLNNTFAEDPYLDKRVKAHFTTEAVDRSLIMLQTALSTYAVIIFTMFDQPSCRENTAVLGVLVVSLFSDLPLMFYIPFTTMYNYLTDAFYPDVSIRILVLLLYGAVKILGAIWTVIAGCEHVCCSDPEMYREQAALAEVIVHREHIELAPLAARDAPRVHRVPREQVALAMEL